MKETSRSLIRFSTLYVYVFAVSGIVIMDVSVASNSSIKGEGISFLEFIYMNLHDSNLYILSNVIILSFR